MLFILQTAIGTTLKASIPALYKNFFLSWYVFSYSDNESKETF